MTSNSNVTKTSTEQKPIAEISKGGQVTIPKQMRGEEDAYTVEKDEDGRFVLTPVKVEQTCKLVAQSDD
jgi:bifunctional DNA-binding transcriptional regulator/antitoxin component of YhaV-PrlF toxin-antitoxin module